MATTQDGRIMSISTPLGKDFLLLNRISGTEGLSTLFSIEVELLHEENSEGSIPTFVDPKTLLGKAVTIEIYHRDETARTITGIMNRFARGDRNPRFSYYYATIVPNIWVLTQNVQSRIFQNMTVPDILKKVFAGFDVKFEVQGSLKKRNYCVQYRESDFDFASRLMEEEGIYYYFHYTGTTDQMIIANTPQSHRDCPTATKVPYYIEMERKDDFVSRITNLQVEYQLQTGRVTFWSHNFQLKTNKLNAEQPTQFEAGGNQNLEFYDFPGKYGGKFDGIDQGGGEQPSELNNVFPDKEDTAKHTMQALDSRYEVISGSSNFCGMAAGHKFELVRHPTASLNAQYILTSVTIQAEQSPDYISDELVSEPFLNNFTAIKHGAGAPPFRPMPVTPKPVVRGSQTAIVVGPAGEEIFTDKYGRVKVQFHWDRDGKNDASSSCWLRVAQSWAGNRWGTMFIPRIDMEVLVDFLEGDPDQPIITGCVYNPGAMPPYKLPDHKTRMTIKSNSSKGGDGFNEFRFEDKKGDEQIFIHAEKDEDIRVKNDAKEFIGNDRHLIVKNNQMERVEKDKNLIVNFNQNEKIGGSYSKNVAQCIDEKAGIKYAMEAGIEVHLKAGVSMTLEAGATLTLKVGGNFININPAGVFIQGTMVMINSGGAAGSGSGSKPGQVADAKEAENAEAGQKISAPSTGPAKPKSYSQKSQALQNAAKQAASFVAGSASPVKKSKPKKDSDKKTDKKVEDLEKRVEELEKQEKERDEAEKKAAEAEKAKQQKAYEDAMTTIEAIQKGVDPEALKAQKDFIKRRERVDRIMEERRKKKNQGE